MYCSVRKTPCHVPSNLQLFYPLLSSSPVGELLKRPPPQAGRGVVVKAAVLHVPPARCVQHLQLPCRLVQVRARPARPRAVEAGVRLRGDDNLQGVALREGAFKVPAAGQADRISP